MKTRNSLFLILVVPLLLSCSAKLNVYDANGKELKGVPVRSPVLVNIKTRTTYDIAPSAANEPNYSLIQFACSQTESDESAFLPLGDLAYINYAPATFAKSEFKVEFNDTGGTKTISVNSDPAAVTESAANLLSAAIPLLQSYNAVDLAAAGQPLQQGAPDLDALRKSFCILKNTEIVSVTRQSIQ